MRKHTREAHLPGETLCNEKCYFFFNFLLLKTGRERKKREQDLQQTQKSHDFRNRDLHLKNLVCAHIAREPSQFFWRLELLPGARWSGPWTPLSTQLPLKFCIWGARCQCLLSALDWSSEGRMAASTVV